MANNTKLKTTKNNQSVLGFLNEIKDEKYRNEAKELLGIMKEVTGMRPFMWGPSIVGFGSYKYKRKDGSEHEYFLAGFSPRKKYLVVYIMAGFTKYENLMKEIGPHKKGGCCLYMKDFSEINKPTLKKLIKESIKQMKKNYKTGK